MQHQQPSRWKGVPPGTTSSTVQKPLNQGQGRTARRSWVQVYPALTDHPRTRTSPARNNSHMITLRLASLLLILCGLWQIPQAQGRIQRKSETTTTEQTWTSQESGGNTRESMNVLQERPAPRYSGIVNHARKKRSEKQVVLHVQIPLQNVNYADKQVTLTVMIGSEMLCGVAMHPKYNLVTRGQVQCTGGARLNHAHRKYHMSMSNHVPRFSLAFCIGPEPTAEPRKTKSL